MKVTREMIEAKKLLASIQNSQKIKNDDPIIRSYFSPHKLRSDMNAWFGRIPHKKSGDNTKVQMKYALNL